MASEQIPFEIERIRIAMEGNPSDPCEAWGVLNPACARGRDGELYLFPRVVAEGNYSRVGIARVRFDGNGEPAGVERLGYALEPTESWERNTHTAGCEDPRVTYVPELDQYVMAYTAYGPLGPKIALAVSDDLLEWRRLGIAKFEPSHGVEWDFYGNKDGLIFPTLIPDPDGTPSLGLIHRPTYDLRASGGPEYLVVPEGVDDPRPSMWVSYAPTNGEGKLNRLPQFRHHQLIATPQESWESLKIGGGTPPVVTPHGWLVLFHGVSGEILEGVDLQPNVYYAVGAMVLDAENPDKVLYRSPTPILRPESREERVGLVDNVVFPTAVDERGDGRIDVYYGMADSRIGVGKLHVPGALPTQSRRDLVAQDA